MMTSQSSKSSKMQKYVCVNSTLDYDSLPISTSSDELLVSIGKHSVPMNHSGNPSEKSKQLSMKQVSTDLDSRIE